MNIAQIFGTQADAHPDKAALIETRKGVDHTLTFSQLEDAAARTASLFLKSGLRPGDAVLVFVPLSTMLYVTLIALFRLQLQAMFLDPSAGKDHIARCCKLVAPQGFVGIAKAHLLRLSTPALRRIPHRFVTRGWVPGAVSLEKRHQLTPHPPPPDTPPDTPALITFTSGSTGQPKVAVRTHGFLLDQHKTLIGSLKFGPDDVVVSTLPIFVLSHLGAGVTSLIPDADLSRPGSIEAGPVVAQIQRHLATSIEASPAVLERLLHHAQKKPFTLPSLKTVFTGGAPVFPSLLERFGALAPQAALIAVYGSTEAEPIAEVALDQMRPADLAAMRSGAGLLAGAPVSEISLKILKDHWGTPLGPLTQAEFDSLAQPAGSPGEIVVNGAHVLPGYLHGQGDEETKFRVDGAVWHRTGDAGTLDERGRLWLLGRCAARIDDGHGTIYPFSVECALSGQPGLRRSAFVAHRLQRLLVVEANAGLDLDGLKAQIDWAHVDETLAHRLPVDPRHNAKIDYPALFRWLDDTRGSD